MKTQQANKEMALVELIEKIGLVPYLAESLQYINVRDFGDKGMGEGATDDTAAFEQALERGEGNLIIVPRGYYKTRRLSIPPNTTIVGATRTHGQDYGTYIEFTASSGSGLSLKAKHGDAVDYKRIRIENLTLVGNSGLDICVDIRGTSISNPDQILMNQVEVRGMTKSGSTCFYLGDVSGVAMTNVKAKNAGIYGIGLHVASVNWNSGVCSFNNCAFGHWGQSTCGLYVTDVAGHPYDWVFNGCYFAGLRGIHFASGSPTSFVFNAPHIECKQASSDAGIYVETDTYGINVVGGTITGFDLCDYGVYFKSGTHSGFFMSGTRFIDIATSCMKHEVAATFLDGTIIGLSKDNAATGFDGAFAGVTTKYGFS